MPKKPKSLPDIISQECTLFLKTQGPLFSRFMPRFGACSERDHYFTPAKNKVHCGHHHLTGPLLFLSLSLTLTLSVYFFSLTLSPFLYLSLFLYIFFSLSLSLSLRSTSLLVILLCVCVCLSVRPQPNSSVFQFSPRLLTPLPLFSDKDNDLR